MFTKAIRTRSLTALAAALAVATIFGPGLLLADQPPGGLKPVPPMRSVPRPLSDKANATVTASKKLSWRPSERVAPEQLSLPATITATTASPAATANAGLTQGQLAIPAVSTNPSGLPNNSQQQNSQQQMSLGDMFASSPSPRQQRSQNAAPATVATQQTLIPQTSTPQTHAASGPAASGEPYAVAQVAYMQDLSEAGAGGFYVPGPEVSGPGDGALPPRVATQPPSDPFKDPFGDLNSRSAPDSGRLIIQPQDPGTSDGFSIPSLNQENGFQVPNQDSLAPIDSPSDQPGTDAGDPSGQTTPSLEAPDMGTEQQAPDLGPFRSRRQSAENEADTAADGFFGESSTKLGQYSTTSCDELRKRLAARTIRDISLDISPPFYPGIFAKDKFDEKKNSFEEDQLPRVWRNLNGEMLTEGKFIGLEFDHAVIEQQDGQQVEVLLRRLSEPDLAYITQQWGLPQECQMPNIAYQPRQWLPLTMTWKASALCHKPLYFEEVALERYGHTTGPFAQPIISTAHFFVNIAVLPYKMGIHPPSECQYALGYYRPGNCAPWIIPPVPLSLRGALFQAGAIGAGVALIP